MKKDIFELLHHNGHRLDIINDNGVLKLGCVTCGETIIQSDKDSLESIADLYKTLKHQNSYCVLQEQILNYVIKLFLGDVNHFKEYLRNNKFMIQGRYDLKSFKFIKPDKDGLFSTNFNYISNKFISLFDIDQENFKQHIEMHVSKLKKIAEEEGFIAKQAGDSPLVISNEEYNFYGYPSDCLYLFSEQEIEEREENFPTVKDVYTFKDMADFNKQMPSWEDEEEWNEVAILFNYRVKYGLFDYSQLDKKELLKEFLSDTEGYDGLNTFSTVIKKAFNIE